MPTSPDKLHNITHRMRALADQYATQVPVGVPTQIRNLADELDALDAGCTCQIDCYDINCKVHGENTANFGVIRESVRPLAPTEKICGRVEPRIGVACQLPMYHLGAHCAISGEHQWTWTKP